MQDLSGTLDESLRRLASTTASAPPLKLSLKHEPEPFWMRRKKRELAKIDPGLRKQLRALCLGEKPWPLFLHGPAGTGKTCAALCLLDHSRGHYWTVPELCESLIQSQQGGYSLPWETLPCSPYRLWRSVAMASLVVLDELGLRERVSDHQFETIKRVLDCREGLPLVCISNLTLADLARVYDDRLASRLGAGTVIALDGPDRRLTKE